MTAAARVSVSGASYAPKSEIPSAAASCSWCGLVVWSRAGDASGPVVRLLEHWRDAHPGGVPAAMVSEAAWGWLR